MVVKLRAQVRPDYPVFKSPGFPTAYLGVPGQHAEPLGASTSSSLMGMVDGYH